MHGAVDLFAIRRPRSRSPIQVRRLMIAGVAAALLLLTVAPAGWAKASAAPVITSISPSSAAIGDAITVLGRDFGGPKTKVWVGGVAAQVTASTGSRVAFKVPASAPFGLTTVRLANPSGQSASAPFTVMWDGRLTPLLHATGGVSATIGRAGGSLVSGGLRLDIPAGAVSEDVTITMAPLRGVMGTPFDTTYLGGAQLSPEGLTFLAEAELSLPLAAGVRPADVLGFTSTGAGANVHLVPRSVSGDRITIPIWHFTTINASSAGAAGVAAMQGYTPTTAETAAKQAMAIAVALCGQGQDTINGPACLALDEAYEAALRAWYFGSVELGLTAAIGAPYFTAESAFTDWLQWLASVQAAPSDAPAALQGLVYAAESLAVNLLADQARRRLDSCTGTDLQSQIRDVARLYDLAVEGAIMESPGAGLPAFHDAEILRACASIKIDEVRLPSVFARGTDHNTFKARASLDVWSGPNRTDIPISLEFDIENGFIASAPTLGSDGRFEARVSVDEDAPFARVEVTATGQSTFLAFLNLDRAVALEARPATGRLTIDPVGEVALGGSRIITARIAGDESAGRSISFSLSGPGSISAPQSTTGADGAATVTYHALASPGTATLTATFIDGTATRTTSATITIGTEPAIDIDPEIVIIGTGQQQQFTANVTGTDVTSVLWSSSCGGVSPTGLFTAPAISTSCTVTATSVGAPGVSAIASVTVVGASPGTIEDPWAGGAIFACAQSPDQGPFGEGCTFSTSGTTNAWTKAESRTASSNNPGFESSTTGSSSQQYSLSLSGGQARQFTANGTASATADGYSARGAGGTDFDAEFEVVGAPVAYQLTATVTLVESPNWDGGCAISFAGNGDAIVEETCDGSGTHTVNLSGVLLPGDYDFEIFVNTNAQIQFGGTSDLASGSFSVTLTLG